MLKINNYKKEIKNNYQIETWESICGNCGFPSALGKLTKPNGESILYSGAGCFTEPRRDLKVLQRIIDNEILKSNRK